MNREFYQAKAYADGVKRARAMRRPLEVWPSEQHLVKLADLPVVGAAEQLEGLDAPKIVFYASDDAELQKLLTAGNKYAKLRLQSDEAGNYKLGEWW